MCKRSILAVGLACICATSLSAQDHPKLSDALQSTLDSFQERYAFPGATAAVALPDGTVVTAASGMADVEAGQEMPPDARMLAASIGKTFVGATVLLLESKGLVSQTDLLADHLGDKAWFSDIPNAQTITIGHLLRHQSGLPDHPHMPEFQAAAAAQIAARGPAFTPEEVLEFVKGRAALFDAGTGWSYSDTGYILLGLVIEEVAGTLYFEVVQEAFLNPLNLTDTLPSNTRNIPKLAVGYTVPGNPFGLAVRTSDNAGNLIWDASVEWTGGGFASTAHDLALWGHALFNGTAMDAPYLDRLLDGAPIAPGVFYGTGVAIYAETPLGPVYGHGGWIPAYVSSLRHYADHEVTVAFQINTDAGVVDDSNDLVPALEAALVDVAISIGVYND